MLLPDVGLAELHTHLGGSVASDIMWSLAHEQGIALPVKDYWAFDALVTVSDPRGVENLDELDAIYHWTELIQSSPLAVERSVHAAIGGAYRSQRITTLELRFNPMKRNRGGERDLDHIILAAIRGLDTARLEYPQVRAGLILMMDRTFDARQNEIIVEKADALGEPRRRGRRHRGAAAGRAALRLHAGRPDGRDGPRSRARGDDPRRRGGASGSEEIGEVVESLRPDRIGHGILAAGDPGLMTLIRQAGVTLEVCPTSNLLTKALADEDAVRETFHRFVEHDVPFTIATDGPEMMRTHLRDEFELIHRIGALDEDGLAEANARGHAASFVGRAGRVELGRGRAWRRVALASEAASACWRRRPRRRACPWRRRRRPSPCPSVIRSLLRLVDHRCGLLGDVACGVLRPAQELVEESHGRDVTLAGARRQPGALRPVRGVRRVARAGLVVEMEPLEQLAGFLVGLLDRVVEAAARRVVEPVLDVVHGVDRRVVSLGHRAIGAPEEPADGIEDPIVGTVDGRAR